MSKNGFTLLEILIASFLSLIVMAMLIELYLSFNKIYKIKQSFQIEMQDINFISYYLPYEIRQAGNNMCVSGKKDPNFILGFDYEKCPEFIKKTHIIRHSDILLIKKCYKVQKQEQWATLIFYVANTLRKHQDGSPVFSLYQKIMTQTANYSLELVEDIKNIQIKYGIADKKNSDTLRYQNCKQINNLDWQKVKMVLLTIYLNNAATKMLNVYIFLRNFNA